MLNKAGGKVRLTFKLELDQVWIGTKERTDKIPMNSIKSIVSEPIEGFEQYHVMVGNFFFLLGVFLTYLKISWNLGITITSKQLL